MRGAKDEVDPGETNGADAPTETAAGEFTNRLRRSRSFEECKFKTKEPETEPPTDIEIERLAKAAPGPGKGTTGPWQRQDQRSG